MRYAGLILFAMAFGLGSSTSAAREQVVVISGKLVKFTELKLAPVEDGCDDLHYHARTGGKVTALDGTEIVDPFPSECGYGKVNQLQVYWLDDPMVTALDSDGDGLPNALESILGLSETNPDTDGDGVLDGDEDNDTDGASNLDEHLLSWNSFDADFDDDGILDGIELAGRSNPVVIPIIINVLKNSNANVNRLRQAVKLVGDLNPFAAAVAIQVNELETDGGDDGSGGGSAGDGILTPAERTKVRDAGMKQVIEVFGKVGGGVPPDQPQGRAPLGLVISVTAEGGLPAFEGMDMAGEAEKGTPSILIEADESADVMAGAMLHGLFLVLGLENSSQTTTLDDDGANNFMTSASSGRNSFIRANSARGLRLTRDQLGKIADIDGDAVRTIELITWPVEFDSPGVRGPSQGGSVYDGDQAEIPNFPIFDLAWVVLRSAADDDEINVVITTFGALPDDVAFDTLTFSVVFDTDADEFTGGSVDGFSGIDRELVLRLTGTGAPGGIAITASVGEAHADEFTPLPGPRTQNVVVQADLDVPGELRGAQYSVRVPKDLLDMTAIEVPVGVITRTSPLAPALALADTASLIFDRGAYLKDPLLTLFVEFARPGDTIDFDVTDLTPNSPFELIADSVVVQSGMLDSVGAFSGSFVYPDDTSGPKVLAAVDDSGNFALNEVFVSDLAPVHLMLDKAAAGDIDLDWTVACASGAEGYGIYEGTLGSWYSHRGIACTDSPAGSSSITPGTGDRYYLVVGNDVGGEGSYGQTSENVQRPAGGDACRSSHAFGTCP